MEKELDFLWNIFLNQENKTQQQNKKANSGLKTGTSGAAVRNAQLYRWSRCYALECVCLHSVFGALKPTTYFV